MTTICFDKPSMPYNTGEVATFDQAQANRYRDRGIAHEATREEIEAIYKRHKKQAPPEQLPSEPAPATEPLSRAPASKGGEDMAKNAARGR